MPASVRGLVRLIGQRETERDHALGTKARIDVLQAQEALDEQRGARDHRERERNLGNNQHLPDATVAPVLAHGAPTRAQPIAQSGPRQSDCGQQACGKPGGDPRRKSEACNCHVDTDLLSARDDGQGLGANNLPGGNRHDEACNPTDETE